MTKLDQTNSSSSRSSKETTRGSRLTPEERRKMILEGAVAFFSAHGFSAQTTDLAKFLGISEGLIFRYFGTKAELIENVYNQNYISRYLPHWEAILDEGSKPLRDRLIEFYTSYLEQVDDHDWVRISLYSGLSGNELTKRYIEQRVEPLLTKIAGEAIDLIFQVRRKKPSLEYALEQAWHLHSTFIYYIIRKHVFYTKYLENKDELVAMAVDGYIAGLFGQMVERPISSDAS